MDNKNFLDSFELDVTPISAGYYSEAVFKDGKKKIQPILEDLTKIKAILMEGLKDKKTFDHKAFWKDQSFKDLEDHLVEIFGFRSAYIAPQDEYYYNKSNKEKADILNAYIYQEDRYFIEGIVTDDGFYDKTHSSNINITFTLGMIKKLEPDEILAILLHEIGHSIDPALVDIRYTETNILTKYITNRKSEINKSEKKYIEKKRGFIITAITAVICSIPYFFKWLYEKIFFKQIEQRKLDKIRDAIKHDNSDFNHINFAEAYADNFARMYGYGPQLIKALKKASDHDSDIYHGWYKKELVREELITSITKDTINDEHKTNIHRIRALIKEYDKDINDTSTPKKVKEYLKKDKEEVEKILDQYLNHRDDFQRRINIIINEELEKKDPLLKKDLEEAKKAEKEEKSIKEYTIGFNIDEIYNNQ